MVLCECISTYKETEESVARVKIVREQALSTYMSWGPSSEWSSALNQWGETTLKDGTIYKGATLKPYLNDGEDSYYNSLSSIAKEQMTDALWYTGAVVDDTARGVYEDERSNVAGTSTKVNYTTRWVGKVGLIYPSDFGYA